MNFDSVQSAISCSTFQTFIPTSVIMDQFFVLEQVPFRSQEKFTLLTPPRLHVSPASDNVSVYFKWEKLKLLLAEFASDVVGLTVVSSVSFQVM